MEKNHSSEYCKKIDQFCEEHDCCKVCHLLDDLYYTTLALSPDFDNGKKHPLFERISDLYLEQIKLCCNNQPERLSEKTLK